jgi:Tfp pilus assembly protein PilX
MSKPHIDKNQQGLTSFVVVSVLVIILMFLTVGFVTIVNRQIRQTLDNELAAQATFSAQSGLNDAKDYINKKLSSGADPSTNNDCLTIDNTITPPFVQDGNISGDFNNNANDTTDKYTCIIINSRPKQLIYNINAGSTATFKIIPYSSTSGNPLSNISDIFMSWENNSSASGSPQPLPLANTATHRLPKEDEYNNTAQCTNNLTCTGMLEVSLYPVFDSNAGNNPNQDSVVAANARTFYLYANGGNGSAGTMPYTSNGQFVNGNCNDSTHPGFPALILATYYCNSTITNLPDNAVNGARFYYMRVKALYTSQSVSIQAANSSSNPAYIGGAQAIIDVTGKGGDVLKRIVGRESLSNNLLPDFAMQSVDTICKRFKIPIGSLGPTDYQPALLDDSANNVDNACTP